MSENTTTQTVEDLSWPTLAKAAFLSREFLGATGAGLLVGIVALVAGILAVVLCGVMIMAGAFVAGRAFAKRGNDTARDWAEWVFIVALVACILGNLALIF